MDTLLSEWNTESGAEFPLPIQRKSLGLEKELVELLWQNGEVVLHSQTHRSQDYVHSKQSIDENPNNLVQNPWMDYPIDVSFEREFCANLLPEIQPDLAPLPKRKLGSSETPTGRVVERQDDAANECSARTIGSTNRLVNENCGGGSTDGLGIASSCRESDSNFWKMRSTWNDTNTHKRKIRGGIAESECWSDATELESAAGNKSSSHKSGATNTTRRSRVAEVHNLSERKRRDRINEKMKALQELIPHSNKSDKASMLDEAIEYMKSLQLQLQLMWMGSGMTPMMIPGMQQQHYMSPHVGMRVGLPMLPAAIQSLMRLSSLPLAAQAMTASHLPNQPAVSNTYQNQMLNSSFPEHYGNYAGFHPMMPNALQPMNMFNFNSNSAQHQMSTPQTDSSGPIG